MLYLPLTRPPLGLPWQINRASQQAKGLLYWWPTIRPGGGYGRLPRIQEVVGGYQHGTPGSGPTRVSDGVMGDVILTSSAFAYIILGSGFKVPTASGAFVLWWKMTLTPASGNRVIASISNGTNRFVIGPVGGTFYAGWMVSGNDDRASFSSASMAAGTWYHMAVTWVNGGPTRIYLDGILAATNDGNTGATWDTSGSAILVGLDTTTFYSTAVRIVDIRLYDRALEAAEVRALHAPQTRWELYGVLQKPANPFLTQTRITETCMRSAVDPVQYFSAVDTVQYFSAVDTVQYFSDVEECP